MMWTLLLACDVDLVAGITYYVVVAGVMRILLLTCDINIVAIV